MKGTECYHAYPRDVIVCGRAKVGVVRARVDVYSAAFWAQGSGAQPAAVSPVWAELSPQDSHPLRNEVAETNTAPSHQDQSTSQVLVFLVLRLEDFRGLK